PVARAGVVWPGAIPSGPPRSAPARPAAQLDRDRGTAGRRPAGPAAGRAEVVALADDQGIPRPAHAPRGDLLPRPLFPRKTQLAGRLAVPPPPGRRGPGRQSRAARRPVQSARLHHGPAARFSTVGNLAEQSAEARARPAVAARRARRLPGV